MKYLLAPTIGDVFLQRVKRSPSKVGFSYKANGRWVEVTYKDFCAEVKNISNGLRALGIVPHDRIAILSNTRYEWQLSDMAILGAGAIPVPIYPSLNTQEIKYLLENSGAKLLFLEDENQLAKLIELKGQLPDLKNIVVFNPFAMAAARIYKEVLSLQSLIQIGNRKKSDDLFEDTLQSLGPDSLFTLCYTSGTTGTPKGAMITHDNLMSVLEDCVRSFSSVIRPEKESTLAFLPFSHIMGRIESMAAYVFGWKITFAESIESLPKNLIETRPTLLVAVPRIFEKAFSQISTHLNQLSKPKRKLVDWALECGKKYYQSIWTGQKPAFREWIEYESAHRVIFKGIGNRFGGQLKGAICGGAPLSKEVGEFLMIAGLPVFEGYGLTETCGPIAVNTPDYQRFGSVGKPLPEVSVKIAADGEILIKSRKVFKGYYRMESETQEAFDSGWYKTGDVGHINAEGFLFITDRKKDLIITSQGKNIAPQKIENLAKHQPPLSQLIAIGDRKKYISALVTLEQERVLKFAAENQILFSDYSSLIRHPKIEALAQRAIDAINIQLGDFETIKKFTILASDFSIESGELTPSLKPKRNIIQMKYAKEIDAMY